MKASRRRGRPRGRFNTRSHADYRLLEYLAFISLKHGIDANKFFDRIVNAWKGQRSKCDNIIIECRMRTRSHAVFLIAKDTGVIAQFPIPNHILEIPNPLKEFSPAKSSTRIAVQKPKLANIRIEDLKSGMKQIKLTAKVLKIQDPKSVITRFGEPAKVTNANIEDETGTIQLSLWNKQIDIISVGDVIQVENARVVTFRGERQLRVGRNGQLNVIEKMQHS